MKVIDISEEQPEDCLKWDEDQLRVWYEREGMDYDKTVERGLVLIERLMCEHRERSTRRKARQS